MLPLRPTPQDSSWEWLGGGGAEKKKPSRSLDENVLRRLLGLHALSPVPGTVQICLDVTLPEDTMGAGCPSHMPFPVLALLHGCGSRSEPEPV